MKFLTSLEARRRLFISLGIAVMALLLQPTWIHLRTRLVIAWDLGALCFLGLAWLIIITANADQTSYSALNQDQSDAIMLTSVLIGDSASLGATGLNMKGVPTVDLAGHVLVSVVAITCAWLLVHTMFTLHYAHRYYRAGLLKATKDPDEAGGLDFPGQEPPDYLDFAYFSFVIGMTCQVSDVQITSRAMRRLALGHGVLSFGFNTVILALSVNILAGLL